MSYTQCSSSTAPYACAQTTGQNEMSEKRVKAELFISFLNKYRPIVFSLHAPRVKTAHRQGSGEVWIVNLLSAITITRYVPWWFAWSAAYRKKWKLPGDKPINVQLCYIISINTSWSKDASARSNIGVSRSMFSQENPGVNVTEEIIKQVERKLLPLLLRQKKLDCQPAVFRI